MSACVSAAELAERVRSATGFRLRNGAAAMFLGYWLEAHAHVEPSPGRYALTAEGERLGSGLLTVGREERAARVGGYVARFASDSSATR